MSKKTKIGFIQWANPNDRKALSGTPYKIRELLEAMGNEIIWVKARFTKTYKVYDKILRIMSLLTGKTILTSHTVLGAKLLSRTIDMNQVNRCDLLFAPVASEALYSLKKDIPIIYLSDATFASMVGYYFKNLSPWSVKQGNKVEQKALDTSTAIIVSSDWAKNSVTKDYYQSTDKVHVIEFGANLDEKDIITKKFSFNNHLHLLFLGVDWERKGGDIAVEACKWLNGNKIPSTLHIVGIRQLNDKIKSLPYIDYVGFLNKNDKPQYSKLVQLIQESHCLLLPTLAECSAIAFCESSANGLPIFSHITGGVRNYVEDGRNGYLLPLGSTGSDFGKKIKECLDNGELERMSQTAKDVYKEKLNWNVWAKKVEKIIDDSLKNDRDK